MHNNGNNDDTVFKHKQWTLRVREEILSFVKITRFKHTNTQNEDRHFIRRCCCVLRRSLDDR